MTLRRIDDELSLDVPAEYVNKNQCLDRTYVSVVTIKRKTVDFRNNSIIS